MVIEMVDGEPPLFDCPQLDAMRIIRDEPIPSLQNPEQVKTTSFIYRCHDYVFYLLGINFVAQILVAHVGEGSINTIHRIRTVTALVSHKNYIIKIINSSTENEIVTHDIVCTITRHL